MSLSVAGQTFVVLLVIMDPIAALPVFLSLTSRFSEEERRAAAIRATLAAGAIVVSFALGGDLLLRYLDVSIDAIAIAGGLLLLLIALQMLRGAEVVSEATADIALVPLASPLVAGPGAIATVIVLTRQNAGAGGRLSVILGALAAVAAVGVVLLFAARIARLLSPSLATFLTSVLGVIAAAIGVQLIIDGVRGAA
jgi:multiple antibiotic resistance protein